LAGIAKLAKGGDAAFLTAGLDRINSAVEEAIAKFNATRPEASAPALAAGLKETNALIGAVDQSSLSDESKYDIRHELRIKSVQFNDALAEALGLSIAATVAPEQEPNARMAMFMGDPETFRMAIPGQKFGVKVHVVNQSPSPATLEKVAVDAQGQKTPWTISPASAQQSQTIASNKAVDVKFTVTVPDDATFTRPYFTRPDIEQSYYDISDDRFLNQPLAPYPLAAWAEFSYEGAPVRIGQTVQTVKRENGLGSVYQPLAVAPAVGIAIAPRFGIVPLNSGSFPVSAVVHSNVKGPAKGTVRLDLPPSWRSDPPSVEFATVLDGQDQTVTFNVTPSNLSEKPYEITAIAEYNGKQFREGYTITGYSGLRPYFLYKPSTYRTTGVDVKVAPGLKVGYIMGSGDDVPSSLEHLGIKVTFLSPADIANGDLSKFDAILMGVRTYAVRPELATNNNRILDYVKNGGVVIVQYNTPEYDKNYGPYPYQMGNNPEEVTDEASKIEILNPSNPIFNWPNKITAKDFTGG
jgi:hypothetical protein